MQASCKHKGIVHTSCFIEVQYKSTIWYCTVLMVSMVCTTKSKCCPLYLEIDTTKSYGEINKKLRYFIQKIMSLSRNVNLDKLSVCHASHEGSTIVIQGRQGPSIFIERSIIGGGLTLLMGVHVYD